MHAQPRIDKGPDEPRPHRALVIRGIARAQVAEVLRLVILVTGLERPQTERRQQTFCDDIDNRFQRLSSSTG